MPAPVVNTTNTIKVPQTTPLLDADGKLSRVWFQFLGQIGDSDAATCDTHANRANNFPATTRDIGQFYYETDRGLLYLNLYNANTQQIWMWILGSMTGTFSPDQRPADLGVYDAGIQFFATDATVTWEWNGTAWVYQSGAMSGTRTPDTRPTTLGADDAGFLFDATDVTTIYKWSGTAWAYQSGQMNGTLSPDQRPTLAAADAGFMFFATDATVTLEWNGTAWTYSSGEMQGTLSPDQRPTLTAAEAGFLFYSTDFDHHYEWSGTAWAYTQADPGSAWIRWTTEAPTTGVWHIADGTAAVSRSMPNGSVSSVTMPPLTAAYPKGAAAYTGTVVPGSGGSLSGATIGTAHTGVTIPASTGGPSATTGVATGSIQVASSSHTHTEGSLTDPGHTHTLTGGTLSAGEPDHLALLPYFRL